MSDGIIDTEPALPAWQTTTLPDGLVIKHRGPFDPTGYDLLKLSSDIRAAEERMASLWRKPTGHQRLSALLAPELPR
jgi:hypothetical protein